MARFCRGGSGAPRNVRRARNGFTLIELSIAISILMIGMVSVVSATSRMHNLRRQNRERTLAQNATRSIAERIHARSYQLSVAPETWSEGLLAVFGPAGSFGDSFDVQGLTPMPGDTAVGRIQILTDETLLDRDVGAQLGLPRDLNGDGDVDSTDVSNDARILPVRVQVRWRSQSGLATYDHAFYVMGY